MRKKAEDEKKKVISQLLAAEGLELDTDDDEAALQMFHLPRFAAAQSTWGGWPTDQAAVVWGFIFVSYTQLYINCFKMEKEKKKENSLLTSI